MILPPKLKTGDQVRIVAPSCTLPSAPWLTDEVLEEGKRFFTDLGMTVTEGKYLREIDAAGSTTIEYRLADLHDAYADPDVKALLCIRGGWNVNQLLPFLDYEVIRSTPKILCGFSDITALGNAITAKTGVVTYSGPNFNQFCMGEKLAYARTHFLAAVMKDEPITLTAAPEWTDSYFQAGKPWAFEKNEGWWTVHEGEAEGTCIGGNLCTLSLLQGTDYMPVARDLILFLEDDHETHPRTFDRDFTSLTQQPWFERVRGLLIGRFQRTAVNQEFGPVTKEKLLQILARNEACAGLPIIANVDFGHTYPIFTFPIGGTARMSSKAGEPTIVIQRP